MGEVSSGRALLQAGELEKAGRDLVWSSRQFCPQPHPSQGRLGGDVFGCHDLGWGLGSGRSYWHLLGGGQGRCYPSVMHRTAPTTKNYLAKNVSSAEVGKTLLLEH